MRQLGTPGRQRQQRANGPLLGDLWLGCSLWLPHDVCARDRDRVRTLRRMCLRRLLCDMPDAVFDASGISFTPWVYMNGTEASCNLVGPDYQPTGFGQAVKDFMTRSPPPYVVPKTRVVV